MLFMRENSRSITISTATMMRFFGVCAALALVYFLRDILAALLFAVIVASAMEPGIQWLKARRIPRVFGVLLIFLVILAALFLVVYLVFPVLAQEISGFIAIYPRLETQIVEELQKIGLFSFVPSGTGSFDGFFGVSTRYVSGIAGGAFDILAATFGGLLSSVLVVVFSFYLATQEKGIEGFLKIVTPVRHEPYIIDLWGRSQKKLGRWFQAQMLLGAVVGVFIFFGLSLLQVPNALLLALLAALFEIIPVVGPILAAVPATAIAFLISPFMGLAVIILYVLVQQAESHVIVPVVMRRAVGLSPLIVVLALIIGAKIGGIFGLLLAVPVTTIVAEVIEDWDKKKRAILPG